MAQDAEQTPEAVDAERKKGAAELLVLSLLEERQRHGYELAQLIERRSRGVLSFHVSSLYTLLYRLEKRALVRGRWVEKPGERRRRFYELTDTGERARGPGPPHGRAPGTAPDLAPEPGAA
jgi:PadR family transcriptional regulator PadR